VHICQGNYCIYIFFCRIELKISLEYRFHSLSDTNIFMLSNKFRLKTGKNSEIKWIYEYYLLLNSVYMKNVTFVEVPYITICT